MQKVVPKSGRFNRSKSTVAIVCAAAVSIIAASAPSNATSARRTLLLRPQTEVARPPSPMLLAVSIKKQRVRVFDANGEIASSRISSGQPGFDTPTGVFSILEKNEVHESNIYEGAPMPNMQRITWSGIALHAGVVPGYRASHGCIRLPASFAKSLFSLTKIGNRVVVTPDEIEPIAFDHPTLFKPLPAETPKTSSLGQPGDMTQVASNSTGADSIAGSLGEFPLLIGVSPALAEAARESKSFAPPDRPRSRAEADRMAIDKINKLQAALKNAESQKLAASERAKRAVAEADAVAPKIASAKQVLDPLRAQIDVADKKLDQALRAFADFMSGKPDAAPLKSKTAEKISANPEEREVDLEDAILDMRIEAEAARADLARREMDFAAMQGTATAAGTARTTALDDVRQSVAQLRSAQADLIEANKEMVRRSKPVAVFISLKSERIYIRQGTEPLLEAPIALDEPGRRVGTHVFTAMRYGADPNTFDWRLMSAQLPATADEDDDGKPRKGKRRDREVSVPHTAEGSVRMARRALDQIKIPPDILQTITDLAQPGASLIISDRELPASENGLGTEFVVLTR